MKLRIALAVGFALSVVLAGAAIVAGEEEEEKNESGIVDVFAAEDINKGEYPFMGSEKDFYIKVYVYIDNTTEREYQVNLTLSKKDGDVLDILYNEGFTYNVTEKKGHTSQSIIVNESDTDRYYLFYFPLKSKGTGTLKAGVTLWLIKDTKFDKIAPSEGEETYEVPIGQVKGSCFGTLILPLGILSIGLVYYERDKRKKKQ